ncbi:MAG: hypothetical protein FJ146_01670 [Deltaproteobacteria bacterium]|nr:hypothetical protein [Deltaproteobacteria bacterium]
MNLRMPAERLTQLIQSFAQTALTSRQVAKRLNALFASRYLELKGEWVRRCRSAAKGERLALTDVRYEQLVRELTDIKFHAVRAHVEYETHAMLFKARQSLRPLRRR